MCPNVVRTPRSTGIEIHFEAPVNEDPPIALSPRKGLQFAPGNSLLKGVRRLATAIQKCPRSAEVHRTFYVNGKRYDGKPPANRAALASDMATAEEECV